MRRSPQTSLVATAIVILAMAVLPPVPSTRAASSLSLVTTYAPVLHFASGEKFFPTSVDNILSTAKLELRNPDGSLQTVSTNPTTTNLGSYQDSSMFLDTGWTKDMEKPQTSYYAYVHIANQSGSTVIQYWLFYVYNNGPLNDHQTDIEVVEIFVNSAGNPTQAIYSQHLAGESASWGDVETSNGHPVMYVALGSHANYFRAYQGRIGIENDVVNGGGITITPDQLTLVLLRDGASRPADQNWLNFPGRWGYVGTNVEIATGMAGPYGPVYNDNGIRYSDPTGYLNRTFAVGGYYFDLAWVAANLLLLILIYVAVRAAIKLWGIIRLRRSGGLHVKQFLAGRGKLAVALGLLGVAVTVIALFLPWYTVSASSQSGPLAGQNPVTLMSVDGINGLSVNIFLGPNADSTSGLTSFASTQVPFAIMIGAGLILLILDIIGVKKGKTLGRKLIFGAITSLLPFIFIYAFVAYLPNLVPLASSLFNQQVPSGVTSLVNGMAAWPVSGSATQTFPTVGATSVTWGFGIGAYLFLVAAVIRIVAGWMCRSVPELQATPPPATVPAPAKGTATATKGS